MQKLYAVLGDPIAHSMSPVMHNDLFGAYGIHAHYHPLLVKKETLQEAVTGLKAIGISGFNVTVPHKERIIPFLDYVDPLAAAIGAVNTVVNIEGKLQGYNTDGTGYVAGLQTVLSDFKDRRTLVIGAGGAARGIYFALAAAGVQQMDLCNRTAEKAELIKNECPYEVETNVYSKDMAEKVLSQYGLIIQTTPIGMSSAATDMPLSLQHLDSKTFVSDIIYNPLYSPFLLAAKNMGAEVQNGLPMFVYQGALAFELWTGIKPDTNRMKKLVLSHLGG
ncbi:shikimate dehydrogenase [Cytobacillus gottheilii]|uniref:shikimate dehydrogenase n=1 Tax=Cytobacillus gottheilii TaxID=859144 RepID=UPI0009B9E0B9|nr:shikimate dehydrogenase [Cytobacillus gottheilii]